MRHSPRIGCLTWMVLVWTAGWTTALVRPTSRAARDIGIDRRHGERTTRLHVSTGWDNFCIEALDNKDINPEIARRFRRTVYTHDDWKKHRSQDRFGIYLNSLFSSGVYQNSKREVYACTTVALLVCVYNALVSGYTDFAGVSHGAVIAGERLGLPLAAFTVTSPSLGLLLTFRANSSYRRWDEARKNWGMNINHTRDLVRMANTYYDATHVPPEQRQDDLNHVALCTWAFVRAMKRHLSPEEEDEKAFRRELYEKLPEQQAAMIIASAHRPNRALQDLSYAIDNLPMHFARKNEIHAAATIFEDNLGSSERLLTSPVPLVYSRHTARFIGAWLLLLPFALYDTFGYSWNHAAMVPATFVLSVFLLGIDELATQLEEPFTILPMQAFCDKIYNWCMEIVSWSPGDNGRKMKPVKPEHAFFLPGPTTDYTSPRPFVPQNLKRRSDAVMESRPQHAFAESEVVTTLEPESAAPAAVTQVPAQATYSGSRASAQRAPPTMKAASSASPSMPRGTPDNGGGLPPPSPHMSMEDFLKNQSY